MKYIATTVVALAAGAEVGLTKEQAAARRHCVAAIADRKGWYGVTAPLQFKAGESFLYEGDLPKHLADAAEPAKRGPSKAEQEAAAKATQSIEAARAKVADAEKALAAAQGDDEIAKAADALKAAQAELADLKG